MVSLHDCCRDGRMNMLPFIALYYLYSPIGSLVSEEPRLARKLLDPLVTMIKNTAAKSLQYECMHTITLALPYTTRDDGTEHKDVPRAIAICSQYLKVRMYRNDDGMTINSKCVRCWNVIYAVLYLPIYSRCSLKMPMQICSTWV